MKMWIRTSEWNLYETDMKSLTRKLAYDSGFQVVINNEIIVAGMMTMEESINLIDWIIKAIKRGCDWIDIPNKETGTIQRHRMDEKEKEETSWC